MFLDCLIYHYDFWRKEIRFTFYFCVSAKQIWLMLLTYDWSFVLCSYHFTMIWLILPLFMNWEIFGSIAIFFCFFCFVLFCCVIYLCVVMVEAHLFLFSVFCGGLWLFIEILSLFLVLSMNLLHAWWTLILKYTVATSANSSSFWMSHVSALYSSWANFDVIILSLLHDFFKTLWRYICPDLY